MRHVATAALLTLIAALLRFPRLIETPAWDGDEGYNLEIAWQLLHGRAQAFAVTQSYVQHPILYYALLAPLLAAAGRELAVARALATGATALAAGVLYLAAYRSTGPRAAFLGGLALAGAHFVVLHSRFAYTYNLALLFTALTALCVARYEERRSREWLLAGALSAALGLLTDQVAIALPLYVALRALPRRREAALALAIGLVPAALSALGALIAAPEPTLADWTKSVSRVAVENPGGPSGPGARLALWFVNYLHLLRAEWWWPAAVIGLFCLRDVTARRRWLVLAGLMALPAFALRELEPVFRTAIPLFVPGALGLGAVLDTGLTAVYRTMPGQMSRMTVAALVVVLPLGLELGRSAGAMVAGFRGRGVELSPPIDPHAARAAAEYVNTRAGADDTVLASPQVAWLVRARTADFFQAVAWTGEPIAFYAAGMPRSRFGFDPSVEAARWAVIDPFWRTWAAAAPPLARLTAQIETWPEVERAGELSVRRNPR